MILFFFKVVHILLTAIIMHYIFLISFGIAKNFKFQIYYSFLVQFSQLGSFRFTLVLSGPFWSLQSIGSILVHFNLISSIWVLLVHFGPFGQIWSTSIHFCPFGKEIMMLFCCDGMGATVGIRVFFGGAVLVAF